MTSINKKILIIEDEESFLSILEKVFNSEGFIVLTAKNGESGMAIAEKENPDLIISDMLMPRLDGLSMAKKLRELKITAPIFFLTNISISEQDKDTKNFDYFVKADTSIDEIVKKAKEKLKI
jgi:DNA-binding response OmpR family regulator